MLRRKNEIFAISFDRIPIMEGVDDDYSFAMQANDRDCLRVYSEKCPISILAFLLRLKTWRPQRKPRKWQSPSLLRWWHNNNFFMFHCIRWEIDSDLLTLNRVKWIWWHNKESIAGASEALRQLNFNYLWPPSPPCRRQFNCHSV